LGAVCWSISPALVVGLVVVDWVEALSLLIALVLVMALVVGLMVLSSLWCG
jgi:hypothetical protein